MALAEFRNGRRLSTMENSSKSATTVKDPVCGMNVEPSTAKHKMDHAGKTYYFCCAHCLEKFRARPEDYLAARPASGAGLHQIGITPAAPAKSAPAKSAAGRSRGCRIPSAADAYVCPMCPEVRSAKPGACPRCGMALEPEMPVAATRVEYTCPMHPEIVRPGPGHCPICGMALEPRTVTRAGRRQSRTARHDAPLLDQRGADRSAAGDCDGSHAAGHAERLLPAGWQPWIELILATPVVLWGGAPFFSAAGRRSSIAPPTCSR